MLSPRIDGHAHIGGAKFYGVIDSFVAITACVERVNTAMQNVQWRIRDIRAGADAAIGIVETASRIEREPDFEGFAPSTHPGVGQGRQRRAGAMRPSEQGDFGRVDPA